MGEAKRSYSHSEVVEAMRVAAEYGWLTATYGRRDEANYELAAATDRWHREAERLLANYDEDGDG